MSIKSCCGYDPLLSTARVVDEYALKRRMSVTTLKVVGIFSFLLRIIPDNVFNLFYFPFDSQA